MLNLNKEEARKIALEVIANLVIKTGYDLVIIEKSIMETDFAWVFPFNTREFVETGNFRKMTIGNGPVVVNRKSGTAIVAPPMPIGQYLEQYKAGLKD